MLKIVVAGTGYVGLVTGVCLAEMGHNVTCVDVDAAKVNKMKSGISPIYEPKLQELLIKNYEEDRLDFTIDYKTAYKDVDVIFIGVGTPEKEDGSANLDYIYIVARQIAQNITKDCLIVVKSTVPIGTNDEIERFLKENLVNNVQIEVASNPEFLAQGTAVEDTLKAKRIVIGVESKRAEDTMREIYSRYNQPILVSDRRSAEMIKYASNDFLALKISFVNEIANLCELVGANIDHVTKGMSYDPRIGDKFLKPGIGYGGSCFPKDTKALHWLADGCGYGIKTVKATIDVNENQKFRLIKKAKKRFKKLDGLKVAVLGLTFKPETDDLREAPSIPNVKLLIEDGAEIIAYDPVGEENFKKIFPTEIRYVQDPEEALKDADLVFIFTEWKEIKEISLRKYKELMNNPVIFDGRNCYSLEEAKESGVEYYSIGRPIVKR